MKIDGNTVLLDIDDKPIKQGKRGEETDVELSDVIVMMLLAETKEEISAKEKIDRMDLALRIRQSQKKHEPIELDFDQVKVIREQVSKHPSPLVVGRVLKFFQLTGE